jgi:hypothetical protein
MESMAIGIVYMDYQASRILNFSTRRQLSDIIHFRMIALNPCAKTLGNHCLNNYEEEHGSQETKTVTGKLTPLVSRWRK